MEQQWIRDFEDPPGAYRAKPFWAWNGRLEEQELLRQIDIFRQMGFGGFFMHARTGLRTGYLSEEWFALTDACTKAAVRAGMEPWIYDEDRWPSGSAGGMVTRQAQYRRKYLTLTVNEAPGGSPPLAEFAAVCSGLALEPGYRRIEWREKLKAGQSRLTFRVHTMAPQPVYNGMADADRLSREATERFLTLTHEQYRKNCGSFSDIQGVFTDEPHRGMVFSQFSDPGEEKSWSLPWTETLPEAFAARFQQSLLPRLPELFLQLSGQPVAKLKWQYMELLQELFLQRYLQPVEQWAHACGKKTTGHFLHEDSLMAQAVPTGSVMRCYEYLDEPGIDNLTENSFAPWAVKQLESVARQLGKQKKLSELYGGTGWQMSFRDYKYVGDWQVLLGINVRCPHLAFYTMSGQGKRDYPGSFLHQATWWQEYPALENYFARLSYVASQGQPVCDTLVLHPVESLWYQIHPGWADGLNAATGSIRHLEQQFRTVFHWLMASQTDFDYADEGLLEKYASVSDGCFRVGKMAYRRILVAGCPCIRESTWQLLRAFQAAGGETVFAGALPRYIGGERDDRCRLLAEQGHRLPMKKQSVIAYFQSIPKPVSVLTQSAREEIYLQTRQTKQGYFALLWNKSRTKTLSRVSIAIPEGFFPQLWDCTTGQRTPLAQSPVLDFAPGQERVLYLCRQSRAGSPPAEPPVRQPLQIQMTGYSLNEPNVLPLDRASLSVDGKPLSGPAEMLMLDKRLRKALHMPLRGGEAVQPWAQTEEGGAPVAIRLETVVFWEQPPDTPVFLAMEPLPGQKLLLNGVPVTLEESTIKWVDSCFRVYALDGACWCAGSNRLTLTADYSQDCGLENMFLLGHFGVWLRNGGYRLGKLPGQIHPGSLIRQGLPFYGGKLRYQYAPLPAGKWLLPMPKIGGSCVAVSCGEQRQVLLWPWQRLELTSDGNAELLLEVVLTRRNTFGPLHRFPIRQPYIDPDSFENADDPHYSLYPTGLLEPLTIYPEASEKTEPPQPEGETAK